MHTSATLISFLVILGAPFSSAQSPPQNQITTCTPSVGPVSASRQRVVFENFVDLLYKNPTTETITEAYTHIAADMIQHAPPVVDGAAASFAIVNPLFTNPEIKVQIINQAFESPAGWVHYRVDGFSPEPTAFVDVFRFNGSCIVEHWDVLQERPVNATSQHPLF
ncbi:hypothetical protein C8R43DRAFT_957349 [Mycena crocata]|nr:hypothetical protein C8R43DRAFT_957349 [Mycena crocata]